MTGIPTGWPEKLFRISVVSETTRNNRYSKGYSRAARRKCCHSMKVREITRVCRDFRLTLGFLRQITAVLHGWIAFESAVLQ
jgi:hypothetical protein